MKIGKDITIIASAMAKPPNTILPILVDDFLIYGKKPTDIRSIPTTNNVIERRKTRISIPNPGFTITALERAIAMIPTIIYKILMPLEVPVSDAVFKVLFSSLKHIIKFFYLFIYRLKYVRKLHVSVLFTYFKKFLLCSYYYNFTMKNISIALTLGILLVSSALIVSIPRNAVAQQQEDPVDPKLTKEEIQAKVADFKTKHPKYAAIVEEIPNLDLKETVKGYLAAGALQKILNFHAKNLVEEKVANATGASSSSPLEETLTEEQIQAKVTEFKTKHPKFAAVVEGISNLDLKETVKGYLGAEVLQKLFKYHAKNLVEEAVATATQ